MSAEPDSYSASEADIVKAGTGWRSHSPDERASLPEVFSTIALPRLGAPWWRRLLGFVGPGYLVAVGYMDPGNWATDIAGGAVFNYALLSVVLLSNFVAIFLQSLSAKLGIATGRDLAQACRDTYPKPVGIILWLSAEVAIIACDVAEVIGAAIALKLLFHIPLAWGVGLTALDVLIVLALQGRGFRWLEGLVITLIGAMIVIFAVELSFAHPDWLQVARGFVPQARIVKDPAMLYIALGILGATVMPHNLYLHSSVVQTRQYDRTSKRGLKEAVGFSYIDSIIALTFALFVNAAILILAGAVFYRTHNYQVGDIETAFHVLSPLVGVGVAAPLFAIALLASGQNSTLTGTLAGQIVLEGFTNFRMAPWLRRLTSRLLAVAPALAAAIYYGESGTGKLLIFSQVVLSIQLSFAVIPLVQITSDARKMGGFVNAPWVKAIGWATAAIIAGLNIYLVWKMV